DRAAAVERPQCSDCAGYALVVGVPTVAVDADRTTDGEVVVGLHHLRREPGLVQHGNQGAPGGTGTDAGDPGRRVELDGVHRSGVQNPTIPHDALTAHGMV